MSTIKETCEAFDFSGLLPRIGEFTLQRELREENDKFLLFSYRNPKGWVWQALYDGEVEDYTVHVHLPLMTFVDISFIRQEATSYWENIQARYQVGVTNLLVDPAKNFSYAYKKKKIPTWDYHSFLPERVGEFTLSVKPDAGIRAINGSYLIATYEHDSSVSGILFFYNTLRDEFFAELRRYGYPEVTHLFDATLLPKFEEALTERLVPTLENLLSAER